MVTLDFTPADPTGGSAARRVAAQTGFDLRVTLRNGENLLLTGAIPVGMLIILTKTPVGASWQPGLAFVATLAVAIIGTAFTSQAISTGFDRRYGVLRLLGLSPLGSKGLLEARCLVSCCIVAGQFLLLAVLATLLGGLPAGGPAGWLLMIVITAAAIWVFTGWALFLAGSLRAEATLAAANAVFLILLFGGGLAIPAASLPWSGLAGLLPSGALVSALGAAGGGTVSWSSLAVLALWGALGSVLAVRFFRWSD